MSLFCFVSVSDSSFLLRMLFVFSTDEQKSQTKRGTNKSGRDPFTISISISMANNDLFVSLVSDIKTYSGKDPLLPWIR